MQKNIMKIPSASAKKQAENKIIWNETRSLENADFFTIGYTGRRVEDILDTLILNCVRTLVDIRQYPVSMYRPEVSKGNLKNYVESRGLRYVHIPGLGVPRDIRAKAIQTGTREVIWNWYDEYVATPYLHNLHHFLNSVEHPVALMCVEIDPCECHRHRLSVVLEQKGLRSFDL